MPLPELLLLNNAAKKIVAERKREAEKLHAK